VGTNPGVNLIKPVKSPINQGIPVYLLLTVKKAAQDLEGLLLLISHLSLQPRGYTGGNSPILSGMSGMSLSERFLRDIPSLSNLPAKSAHPSTRTVYTFPYSSDVG